MADEKVILIAAAEGRASWADKAVPDAGGCEVVRVETGFKALESISQQGADLLIAGTSLEDLSGHQLCSLLKSGEQTRAMPVILIDDGQGEDFWGSLSLADGVIASKELEDDGEALAKLAGMLLEKSADGWSRDDGRTLAWKGLSEMDSSGRLKKTLDRTLAERLVAARMLWLADRTDQPGEFLDAYFSSLGELLGLDCLGLLIANDTGAWIAFRLADGLAVDAFNRLLVEICESVRITTEPSIDRRGELAEEGGASFSKIDILPVSVGNRTRAALIFGSYSQDSYDPATSLILEQLQSHIRPLLKILVCRQEIALLHSQESIRASTDPLTGLYNLEFLVGFLQQQLLFSFRQRLPVGLAIIDIDHLGKINEEHGFEVGDSILTTIASRLLNKTRSSDLIARYGGDEFAVVLPNTDGVGARTLGEKVRRDIEQLSFVTGAGKKSTRVTVSVGCANFNMEDMNPETILRDAKIALQRAKEEGANRVSI